MKSNRLFAIFADHYDLPGRATRYHPATPVKTSEKRLGDMFESTICGIWEVGGYDVIFGFVKTLIEPIVAWALNELSGGDFGAWVTRNGVDLRQV